MEIRKDIGIAKSMQGGSPRIIKKAETKKAEISDKISLGKGIEKLPSKSSIKENITSGAKNSEGSKSFANVVTPYIGTSASMALVSGAPGAAAQTVNADAMKNTLETLEDKNVKFFEQRSFYIPFVQGKFKEIDAGDVAGKLSTGTTEDKKKLRVQPQGLTMLPIMDEKDVKELEVFQVTGNAFSLPFNDTSVFLNDAASSGMELTSTSGVKLGAYGAYNYLTTGWSEAEVGKADVDLVRNGITMMRLTPDKMNDSFAVKKELKESWDAYNELEKMGGRYLKEISDPIGETSFAKRFDIFKKIKAQNYNSKGALTVYNVIAKRTEANETFEDAANYFLDLRTNLKDVFDSSETLQAFNYAKGTLQGKPILEKAFADNIKKTRDINASVKAMRLMTTPIGSESFYDRRDAMQSLVDEVGERGVEAYEQVTSYLKPGENIKGAAAEFADLAKNVSSYDMPQVTRAYEYMKTELKDKPNMQAHFKSLFKRIKNQYETVQMMNSLKPDFEGSTFDSRVKVMSNLLNHLGNYESRECFDWLKSQTKPGENFEKTGKLFTDVLDSVKGGSTYQVTNAKVIFNYARETLKEDPTKVGTLLKLYNKSESAKKSINVYEKIQKPVGGESYAERKNTAIKLIPYDEFDENYQAVCDHIYPGDTMEKVTDQFIAVHQTMGDRSYTAKSRIAFVERKEKSKNDPVKFDRYMKLLKEFKDFDSAKDAQDLLNKGVRNENYEDREKVLLDMFKWEAGASNADEDAVANYELLATRLDKKETLLEAQSRFKMLFDVLGSRDSSEETRDAFTFVADGMDAGTFTGKTAKQVTEELVKALLISDDLEDAKEHVLHLADQAKGGEGKKTIKDNDEYVIIGGVKLKKRK